MTNRRPLTIALALVFALLFCLLLTPLPAAAQDLGQTDGDPGLAAEENGEEPENGEEQDNGEEPDDSDAGQVVISPPSFSITNNDMWSYTLVQTLTVTNTARRVALNVQVEAVLMDVESPGYSKRLGEELNPYPARIDVDQYGQRIAVYHLGSLAPGESVVLTQKYALEVRDLKYAISGDFGQYNDIDLMRWGHYLAPEENIPCDDSTIVNFARQAVGQETDPYAIASRLFAVVNLELEYAETDESQNARDVLARGTAYCEGYANLYLACLRAMGIPARAVSGYLYQPSLHFGSALLDVPTSAIRMNDLRHVWVEFYLPQTGWVFADPTFTYTYEVNGSTYRFVNWSYFAQVDPSRHYIFLSYGDPGQDMNSYTAIGVDLADGVSFNASLKLSKEYVPFSDLQGHWAADPVTKCVEQGYFAGVSKTSFAPDAKMTRAMFVTVLGRIYSSLGGALTPYQSDPSQFHDVVAAAYYSEALGWALDEGLIQGYGEGRFGPDDPITREQMAKIISSFLTLLERDGHYNSPHFSAGVSFIDYGSIANWALMGVQICVGGGLITGYPDGSFRPLSHTTRAEVAVICQRLDGLVERAPSPRSGL